MKMFIYGKPKTIAKSPRAEQGYRKLLLSEVVFLMLGTALLAGCQKTAEDSSIVLSSKNAPSPKVENGLAYDKAALNIGDLKTIVVPENAKVEQGQSIGQVEIFMEKSLHYSGHPATSTSIRDKRKTMGCAEKREKGKIVIATYGEWDSRIEGGSSMKVLIRLPDGVQVERQKNLSGPIRAKQLPKDPPNRPLVEPGKDGWKAITDKPDPKHTAKSVG